jgi:ATP-dependent RNA helicase SUPV3L1/SUV3
VQAEAIISVQAPSLAVSEQSEVASASSELSTPEASAGSASAREVVTEELIEVWRPVRRDEHHPRKPRERHARGRRPQPQSGGSPAAPAGNGAVAIDNLSETPPAIPSADASPPTEPRPGSRRRGDRRTDRNELPERQQHSDRPPHRQHAGRAERGNRDTFQRSAQRGERSSRSDRADRQSRGDRPDRDPELREKYIKGRGDGRRDREPDPNSPFAKLAALKEQLEANKEPR